MELDRTVSDQPAAVPPIMIAGQATVVGPDDKLVLTLPSSMTQEQVTDVLDGLSPFFGPGQVFLLWGGIEMAVVRRELPPPDVLRDPPSDTGEWYAPGVLKPPQARQFPEMTAWREARIAEGARVLTTEEWLEASDARQQGAHRGEER